MVSIRSYGHPHQARGFTLVELLIALALSSVIFISAYQVISNLVQYQQRASQANQHELDRFLATNLINQIFSKSLHQNELYYRVDKNPFFIGRPDSVQVISRAFSEHYDEPGYRVYRVYRKGDRLNVAHRRYDKNVLNRAPIETDSGFDIESLAFSYLGDNGWVHEWQDKRALPEFIKVSMTLAGHAPFHWIAKTGQS
jgi:prepilin-type N-terminal cleavage/methylation domain-containing protein